MEYIYSDYELVLISYVDNKRGYLILEFGYVRNEEPERIKDILCSLKEYVLKKPSDWVGSEFVDNIERY